MRTATGAFATAIVAGGVAVGQCPPQWDGLGLSLAGGDSTVWRSVVWDPDGPGPQGSMLVLGGNFRTIANVVSGHGPACSWRVGCGFEITRTLRWSRRLTDRRGYR
jgi:hypothetical protein